MDIRETNGWLMRWRPRLVELHFHVVYKNEILNVQADALSGMRTLR